MNNDLAGFEQSMSQLEQILNEMNSDGITLDESIKLYAQAATLIQKSGDALKEAEVQIKDIDEKIQALREEE